MPDYWFASLFGRIWLTVRRKAGLRQLSPELPALCSQVARGEQLPASQLGMAEDFATAIWWRSAISAIIPVFIIGVAAKGRFHGTALDALDALLLTLGFCSAIAVMQAVMAFARAAGNKAYLRRAGPGASQQPLPAGELGLPRRWDFWAVLAAGAVLFALIGYAGLHNAPQ